MSARRRLKRIGRTTRAVTSATALLACVLAVTGCVPLGEGEISPPSLPPGQMSNQPSITPTSPSASAVPGASPVPTGEASGPLQPVGEPRAIVSDLDAPWSIVRLTSGSTLISERDTGKILELTGDGSVRDVGTVAGVQPGGEAGLLGLVVLAGDPSHLYAYFTAADDNRLVRMPLTGDAGSYAIGDLEVILDGIPKAGNHNGGRIAFGPDGMLYATAGDAANNDNSQDPNSLGGKILRMKPDGGMPPDNPFPGSLVYSLGHRNPQGVTWTSDGTMWASEFGQNTWDELNIIVPGGNYGWPEVEGEGGTPEYIDPVLTWVPSDASPSGLTAIGDTLFMANLRGQRLSVIHPNDIDGDAATAEARTTDYYVGEFGRIRDVAPGPEGSLWFMTNNTDGRGSAAPDDDKIYEVGIGPVE